MRKSRLRRFKTQITQIFVLVSLFWFLVSEGYAQAISSSELINNAKQFNGKTVTFEGEVVGDIMQRGDFAWINVNDGKNAIGVWINKGLVKDILYTGSYKVKGDVVEITGKFSRSCVGHGGDLDIHAQSITKISSGNETPHSVNKKEINLILSVSSIITVVFLLRLITKKFKA